MRYNGANTSNETANDGSGLRFFNERAKSHWRFREALNPDQEGGSCIALPPDPELRADLAAPTWDLTTRGIQVEEKEKIKDRIGRSPDKGDAVIQALAAGDAALKRDMMRRGSTDMPVMANRGYTNLKRNR